MADRAETAAGTQSTPGDALAEIAKERRRKRMSDLKLIGVFVLVVGIIVGVMVFNFVHQH